MPPTDLLEIDKKGRLTTGLFAKCAMSEKPNIQTRSLPSNPTEIADNINRAFQSSDIDAICRAIGEATRLYNISDMSKKAGIKRESIYRSFGGHQHPNLTTVVSVLDTMGFRLKVMPRRRKRVGLARERQR